MTYDWKFVVDAADPHAQAEFWAAALGYEVEDNSALIERLLGVHAVRPDETLERWGRLTFRDLVAARHPDDPVDEQTGTGLGRRILFQRVPEAKSGKNRLHIDVHVGAEGRDGVVRRLVGLGARVVRDVEERGGRWVLMADPNTPDYQF